MSDETPTKEPIMGGEAYRSFVVLPSTGPPHQSPDRRPELSLDTIFALLSTRRNRHVLAHLAGVTEDAVGITELVAAVTARELSENASDDPSYEAVARAVRHVHLPKLEEAGILEYDVRSKTIRYYGHPKLETYLELARTYETESDANPALRPE